MNVAVTRVAIMYCSSIDSDPRKKVLYEVEFHVGKVEFVFLVVD